jgi:CheY-like chemotaxis protein
VFELNQVLQELQKMLSRLISEDIKLSISLGAQLGRINADPGQIEQVIVNLVVNARDAMPAGGSLSIETRNVELDETYTRAQEDLKPGPYVMLAVSDSGVGMTAELKARIFEPFFTTKAQGKGTGLGLATAFGIVRQSGGHIAVYSELGQGSVFKVYLPRVDRPLDAPQPLAPASKVLRGDETILLVEDEAQVRNVASRILREHGYEVLEAQNGGEAMLLCEQNGHRLRLLLTDVVMPLIGGRQLAGRLGAAWPNLKVLYMSGYTDDAVIRHGVLDAGTAFVQKPLTPQELLSKVRELLDQP